MQILFGFIAVLFGLLLAAILLTVVLVPLCRGVGWFIRHLFAFVAGEVRDALRVFGAVITALVFSFLVAGNVLVFRWSAAAHFGRAFSAEVGALGASLYRIIVGHPARLLGLHSLVEGIEQRVPQALAAAPTRDKPTARTGQFEHYRIVGSLAGGGSGGKLYVAEPDELKRAAFARNGRGDVAQVVIKSFSLRDGSSLPQIVRESRSLDAAKKLGLVLDHELTPERFFYAMPYVPGESLGVVTQRLHAAGPGDGLTNTDLKRGLGYIERLLATLCRYHDGGLWHKDVKPDNIIVHGEEAHLVDFGLITPLRSAMTLTTHGTEYFRDPEMVRMALRGVKVHEVDGARFDIYAAGAVLYALVENSFPAHGGLSQIGKRCPDAVRWIVRRAMTDYDKRYPTAKMMLEDLRFVSAAPDPFAVKPAQLPSVANGDHAPEEPAVEVRDEDFAFVPPATPHRGPIPTPGRPARATVAAPVAARRAPRLRVTNWWSGGYRLEDEPVAARPTTPEPVEAGLEAVLDGLDELVGGLTDRRRPAGATPRRPASEQVQAAQARAAQRRAAAQARSHRRKAGAGRNHASGVNAGVAASLFIFLAFCVGIAGLLISKGIDADVRVVAASEAESTTPPPPAPAAAPAVGEGALPALRGRILVVDDLARPLEDQVASWIRGVLAAIEPTELEVLSTFSPAEEGGPSEAEVNELIAEAKLARARRPLDSEELRRSITEWLDEHAAADVLVWVDPAPAGDSMPTVQVFGSSEIQAQAPRDFLATLQRLFSMRG